MIKKNTAAWCMYKWIHRYATFSIFKYRRKKRNINQIVVRVLFYCVGKYLRFLRINLYI